MRRFALLAVVLPWVGVFADTGQQAPPPLAPVTTDGKLTVVRVLDANTMMLSDGRKIRLLGVEPPKHPDQRSRARQYLGELVKGKGITVEPDPMLMKDRNGCNLGYVHVADFAQTLVNVEMVREGYGFAASYRFGRLNDFRGYQRQAAERLNGIWGIGRRPTRVPATPIMVPSGGAGRGEAGSDIVYITPNGSKYHRQGCRTITTATPMRRRDAEAGGYGRCSVCGP